MLGVRWGGIGSSLYYKDGAFSGDRARKSELTRTNSEHWTRGVCDNGESRGAGRGRGQLDDARLVDRPTLGHLAQNSEITAKKGRIDKQTETMRQRRLGRRPGPYT